MNRYRNKKFLQLILTSAVSIYMSTNLYATQINNEFEDAAIVRAIQASLYEDQDNEFEQAVLLSIREEAIRQNNVQIAQENDSEYLRAILFSMNVTVEKEDEDDIDLLKNLILSIQKEPTAVRAEPAIREEAIGQNNVQIVQENDSEYLRAILFSMNVTVEKEDEDDIDLLKNLILSIQKEPTTVRAEPVRIRAAFLESPESDAFQKWIDEEIIELQNSLHRLKGELTSEIIKNIEASEEDLTDFYGGRDHYNNVLMPQYLEEQKAIKNYAKVLGIIAPADNDNLLFEIMLNKHDVSKEVSQKAYNIMMGIDE